jgi:hypothetical protein
MPDSWSKKQGRELRELQGLAWERELEETLRQLREDFDSWRKGDISAFELSDQIHRFHDGRSRELFNWYSGSLEVFWIAHAVAKGVIDESELSEDLRTELNEDIAVFRERWRGVDRPADSD